MPKKRQLESSATTRVNSRSTAGQMRTGARNLGPPKSEKPQSVSQDEFYRRVDAGEQPYGRGMGLKQGQAYRWLKKRPQPTKVQVTVTPPRPGASEPMTSQTQSVAGQLPPET